MTTAQEYEEAGLSRQQARVQELRDEGLTLREVADQLDIEIGTVKSHRARIEEKVDDAEHLLEVYRE